MINEAVLIILCNGFFFFEVAIYIFFHYDTCYDYKNVGSSSRNFITVLEMSITNKNYAKARVLDVGSREVTVIIVWYFLSFVSAIMSKFATVLRYLACELAVLTDLQETSKPTVLR